MPRKTKTVKRVRLVRAPLPGGALTLAELQHATVEALRGLLRVARIAMPVTYFQTDSRVRRAQRLLVKLGAKEVQHVA